MYTSIVMLALVAGAEPEGLAWLDSYSAGKVKGAEEKKPVLVVLAAGQVDKLGRDGGIGAEAQKLLASRYVCVHVDTTTPAGKKLATSFDIPSGLGIVISDRTGQYQAFRHEGDLTNVNLVRYLQRYGDPTYQVRYTESNPGDEGVKPAAPAPSYCPNCQRR